MSAALSLLLCLIVSALAHNWVTTPSRSLYHSEVSPCKASSNGGRPHVRVQAGQHFQVEWSTGHTGFHYYVFVAQSDADKLSRHTDEKLLEDYFKGMPSADNKRTEPLYTKYHRKTRDKELDLIGEIFKDNKQNNIVGWLKRQMERGKDPYYAVRPAQFKGLLKDTGINNYRNVYNHRFGVNPDNVYQYEHQDRNGCLANDRYTFYKNPKYPWIIGALRYWNCGHDAFNADFAWTKFPANTPPGRYILHYVWRGFFDCTDVEVTSSRVEFPWGTDHGPHNPKDSKFASLSLPPTPGLNAPPPTPPPPTPAPTPKPVIPQTLGNLVLWQQCMGAGSALDSPANPPGTRSGYGKVARGVKMIWNQFLCHNWVKVGDAVAAPGASNPAQHGQRVQVNSGVSSRAQSPDAVPLEANKEYTIDFWYYRPGDAVRVYGGLQFEDNAGVKHDLFVNGAADGAPSSFQITDSLGYGLRVLKTAKWPASYYLLRIRFTTKAAGKAFVGIGPGANDEMYQVAVGIAENAGDGAALLHYKCNAETGALATYATGESLSVTPFTRSDSNGGGRFEVSAHGGVLFQDAPTVRSASTAVGVTAERYIELDMLGTFIASTDKELDDSSNYHRDGELLGTFVSIDARGGCASTGAAIADLGVFDLYSDKVTLSIWFAANADAATGRLLHKSDLWSIELQAGNRIQAVLSSDSTKATVTSLVTAWKKDEWHLVTVRYDGAKVELFYDGVSTTSADLTGNVKRDAAERVFVGGAGRNSLVFNGAVSDIRVYQDLIDPLDIFKQQGTMPGGSRNRDQFSRVDHCSFQPWSYTLAGACKRFEGQDVEPCFAECAANPDCYAVSVQRLKHSNDVFENFRDLALVPDHSTCSKTALTGSTPLTDESFACFPLQLATEKTLAGGETFFQVEDFEDPAFYGSCFVRVALPAEEFYSTPLPLAPLQPVTVFDNGCISCADAMALKDPSKVPIWKKTNVCRETCA